MTKFSPKFLITLLVLFLVSTASSWAYFDILNAPSDLASPVSDSNYEFSNGLVSVSPQEPKTEVCPTNGALYSKTERNAWEGQRPILAMIENHVDARPQSGLSQADIIYEAVAEGAITRFMGVFYCNAIADADKIAPVRSARIYFVNIAAEYDQPVYVHVGGGNCSRDEASGQCTSDPRAQALEELADMGWRKAGGNDFDTTLDVGVPLLVRDYNRLGADKRLAVEHTMVGSLVNIWKEADKRGFTSKMADGSLWYQEFTPWSFSDPKDASKGNSSTDVADLSFYFWDGYKDYLVDWKYDSATNTYLRSTGGQPHVDLENDQQLAASTIVLQYVKEEGPLDIHKHMYYYVIGKGDATIYQNGKVIEAKWSKPTQTSRTTFTDLKGKEIEFTPGQIWVELVPTGTEVQTS